jgi:RecA-family ATPase
MHRRLDDIRKFHGAKWADLADIRLVDLVGEDCVLGRLMKGVIEPAPKYAALDAYMADWNPSLTILDVLADIYGGDECNRAQVRQFINLLKRLARAHNCAILLLAHPSLTGMNTGSGLSGSTDWNNGVRSRLYLQTPKASDGLAPNKNLRTLEGMKANYGERGGKIDLEWKQGVFVRVNAPAFLDKLAVERKADDVFVALTGRFEREGRNVSPNPGPSFAPSVFAKHADACGLSKEQLRTAMDRLLESGAIRIETFGPPSHERSRLVIAEASGHA